MLFRWPAASRPDVSRLQEPKTSRENFADRTSIRFVCAVCAYLPLIGLLTVLLPNLRRPV